MDPTTNPLYTTLDSRLTHLLTSLSIPPPLITTVSTQLLAAYSEPHRHYHNLTHIAFMLQKLDEEVSSNSLGLGLTENSWERKVVELAVWWHDVVYDSKAQDNEVKSIELWEAVVEEAKPTLDTYAAAVTYLIHSTISHSILPSNPLGLHASLTSFFLDLDLSIFAAPPAIYKQYAHDIRKEYIHYFIETYRSGRLAVLKGFIRREKIFLTSNLCSHSKDDAKGDALVKMEEMEEAARKNLGWEVEGLEEDTLPVE